MGAACSLEKARSPRRKKHGTDKIPGLKQQYELNFNIDNNEYEGMNHSASSSRQSLSNPARPRGGAKSINPNQRLCEVTFPSEQQTGESTMTPIGRRGSLQSSLVPLPPPPMTRHDSDAALVFNFNNNNYQGSSMQQAGSMAEEAGAVGVSSPNVGLQFRPLQSHPSDMSTVLPLIRQETVMYPAGPGSGGAGAIHSGHYNPNLMQQKPRSLHCTTYGSFYSAANHGSFHGGGGGVASPRGEHSTHAGLQLPASGTRSSYTTVSSNHLHAHHQQGQGQNSGILLGVGLNAGLHVSGGVGEGGALNSPRQHSSNSPALAEAMVGNGDAIHFILTSGLDKHILAEGSTLLESSHNSSYNAPGAVSPSCGKQPLGSSGLLVSPCAFEGGAPTKSSATNLTSPTNATPNNIRVTNTNTNITLLKRRDGSPSTHYLPGSNQTGPNSNPTVHTTTVDRSTTSIHQQGSGGHTSSTITVPSVLSSQLNSGNNNNNNDGGGPCPLGGGVGGCTVGPVDQYNTIRRRYSSIAEFESNCDRSLDRSGSNLCASSTLSSAVNNNGGGGGGVGVGGGPLNVSTSTGSSNSLKQHRGNVSTIEGVGGGGVAAGGSRIDDNLVRNFNSALIAHRRSGVQLAEANSDDDVQSSRPTTHVISPWAGRGKASGPELGVGGPADAVLYRKQQPHVAGPTIRSSTNGLSSAADYHHCNENNNGHCGDNDDNEDSVISSNIQHRLPSLPGLFDSQRGRPQGLLEAGGVGGPPRSTTTTFAADGGGGGAGRRAAPTKGGRLSNSLFGENMQSIMDTSLMRGEGTGIGRKQFHGGGGGGPPSWTYSSTLPTPTNADSKAAAANQQHHFQRQRIVNIHISEAVDGGSGGEGSRRESGQSGSTNTSAIAASSPLTNIAQSHTAVSFLLTEDPEAAGKQRADHVHVSAVGGSAAFTYSGPTPTHSALPGMAMDASSFTICITTGPASSDRRTVGDDDDDEEEEGVRSKSSIGQTRSSSGTLSSANRKADPKPSSPQTKVKTASSLVAAM